MILFLKGLIIGVGKIMPGVSGSVLAICMNEYEHILNSINRFWKKDNLLYLFKIGIGIIVSILLCSKILFYFVNSYYNITMILFAGLIFGCIDFKRIKKQSKWYWILIGIIILLLLGKIKFNFAVDNPILQGFIIGVIESLTTIIPGISGTAILTNLGLYNDYLFRWGNLSNITLISQNIAFFSPFLGGFGITTLFLSKIISNLFEKYRNITDLVIIGFVISSFLLILKNVNIINLSLGIIVIYLIIFISGYIISYYFNKSF